MVFSVLFKVDMVEFLGYRLLVRNSIFVILNVVLDASVATTEEFP